MLPHQPEAYTSCTAVRSDPSQDGFMVYNMPYKRSQRAHVPQVNVMMRLGQGQGNFRRALVFRFSWQDLKSVCHEVLLLGVVHSSPSTVC